MLLCISIYRLYQLYIYITAILYTDYKWFENCITIDIREADLSITTNELHI